MKKPKLHSSKLWIAAALFMGTVAVLVVTEPSIGLTWDEPTYIAASESYISWMGILITQPAYALSDQGIQKYWSINHESSPFDKICSGLVWSVSRRFLNDRSAHRLGNMLLSGLLTAMVFLMVAQDYGLTAGLAASFALLTMPRFFFHQHLAALDVPVSVMIFAVGFVFWQTKDRQGWKWTLLLGVVWGLALSTKINALFIPAILLPLWTLFLHRRRYLFNRLLYAGAIGVFVSAVLWPWIYYDPINRIKDFLSFMTLHHYEVFQYYLGHRYAPPNWHFSYIITLLVVPFSLTILYFLGALRAVLHWKMHPMAIFFIFGGLVSIMVVANEISQVFDNERLLMPAFPFLAALAGVGFDWLWSGIRHWAGSFNHRALDAGLLILLIIIVFVPHLYTAARLYPHLLSYYSEAVGGLPGAVRLGFETTYWCETYASVLTFINQAAPQNAVVWGECRDVLFYYQREGDLRPDIRVAGGSTIESIFPGLRAHPAAFDQADLAIIQVRESGFTQALEAWLAQRQPAYQIEHRGIRLIGVFMQAQSER